MYSLLLLSSLLHITTCTDYTVTPDDHYYPNTTCHHCHNLQHYLLNITKYFTSNTQLLFLPGLHHLHTDLIIQNVHNILLIGSTTNDTTSDIVISSDLSSIMINMTRLTIKYINIDMYSLHTMRLQWAPLTIMNCSFVSLYHLQVQKLPEERYLSIVAINIMGDSYFSHVTCYDKMQLLYNETHTELEHHSLTLNNCTLNGINLDMFQRSYRVTLRILNMQVKHEVFYDTKYFIHTNEFRANKVMIINCNFFSNTYSKQLFLFASTRKGSVQFIECQFIDNTVILEYVIPMEEIVQALIILHKSITVEFNTCNFHSITNEQILQAHGENVNSINVFFKNTNYTATLSYLFPFPFNGLISLSDSTLTLVDSVNFHNIAAQPYNVISLEGNSTIIISGTMKFSHNDVNALIDFNKNSKQYIIIKKNTILNIGYNVVKRLFNFNLPTTKYPYPFCFFQYFGLKSSNKETKASSNFLIKFNNNICYIKNCAYHIHIPISNCQCLTKSLFKNKNTIPLEVNSHYIQFINNSDATYKLSQIIEQSSLCVCTNELHYDCHINDFGYLYPGQTLTISLYHRVAATANAVIKTDINQQYVTPCIVLDINENLQLIDEHCTKLHYTIGFPTDNWCELFLKIASDSDAHLNIFYVRQTTCPTGFVKIDKRCQCDPVLVQYGITYCNINDQTILCPANSWIFATTHNNSYTYHISLHCPFNYCLPHSSHHNFSTPNSQCQFNRSGLLCGHCQQGLSTVFSSTHCQHCFNIYLLLIIPIAVVGVIIVLLLFAFNLTVTDGTINGFILYVNVISINTPVFFY